MVLICLIVDVTRIMLKQISRRWSYFVAQYTVYILGILPPDSWGNIFCLRTALLWRTLVRGRLYGAMFFSLKGNHLRFKGELHSYLWNLTFVNKLQCPLTLRSFVFKVSKNWNRSWDIYVSSCRNMLLYIFWIIRNY